MTRINVVDPSELMDQHLLAELRELPRLFTYIEDHMTNSKLREIPKVYTMGAGHMKFFADKGFYLYKRMLALYNEAVKRGINFKFWSEAWDERYKALGESYKNDYSPDDTAVAVNRKRLSEKLEQRPGWYRYYGKVLP